MKLSMPRPSTRDDSSVLTFRQKLPADIAAKARGRTVRVELPAFRSDPPHVAEIKLGTHAKVSLRTRDPACAKVRAGAVMALLEAEFDLIRNGPRLLSHREIVALSRKAYDALVIRFEDNPGPAARWARAIDVWNGTAHDDDAPFDDEVESVIGEIADWACGPETTIPRSQRSDLLREVFRSFGDASSRLQRAAEGDYSPDTKAARFPTFEAVKPSITLATLFDRWAAETKPAGSTMTTTRGIVTNLDRHVQGCGVASITAERIVAWKDALLASSDLTPRTVNDTYLAMMRALFNWGVANKLLKANPAQGVKVTIKAQAGTSMLPYSDDEVARLLTIARTEKRQAYRWLPWMAATTGARIGELAQAWGSNFEMVDGVVVLHIRPAPDAGSLKTESSERTVPIHHALLAEGFLDFVRSKGDGPLFYKRSSGKQGVRHASKGVANHLGTWVREQPGFDDARKAPNHALRHWWKSAAFKAGVPDSVADFLQGHRSPSVAARYRHFDIPTLAAAVSRVPIPQAEPIVLQTPT